MKLSLLKTFWPLSKEVYFTSVEPYYQQNIQLLTFTLQKHSTDATHNKTTRGGFDKASNHDSQVCMLKMTSAVKYRL